MYFLFHFLSRPHFFSLSCSTFSLYLLIQSIHINYDALSMHDLNGKCFLMLSACAII